MRQVRVGTATLTLVLLSTAGCYDLEVVNLNDPDRERALAESADALSLVSTSFNTWFRGVYAYGGPGSLLSNAALQNNPPWSCSGAFYGAIPRRAVGNDPSAPYYRNFSRPWFHSYRAITGVADGLRALSAPATAGPAPDRSGLALAFARFNLGLSHATVAALYDLGFAVDETWNAEESLDPVGYMDLMEIALGHFDDAITLAGSSDFTVPFEWMQADVDSHQLARIAHSYKARFRAQVARTSGERAAVDWSAVIQDVDAGIRSDFSMLMDWNEWPNDALGYSTWPSRSQLTYFMYGMADQSGSVQEWLATPFDERSHLRRDGRPVLIVTPDLRFPQGVTLDEQRATPGRYFRIASAEEEGDTWKRPSNGTWRWSWYKALRSSDYFVNAPEQPEIRLAEMRLLKAEALYRLGDRAAAAAIVNETRTAAGLNGTDATGSNSSCVPRLPDGSCGGLWEMLKWEKRMEVGWTGVAAAGWWFDGRAWGDLWKNSPLQFPVPCEDLRVLRLLPCYSFGGPGGKMGSLGSTYGFPSEDSFYSSQPLTMAGAEGAAASGMVPDAAVTGEPCPLPDGPSEASARSGYRGAHRESSWP